MNLHDSSTGKKKEIVKHYFWRFAQVSVRSQGHGGYPSPMFFHWSLVPGPFHGVPQSQPGGTGTGVPPAGTREPFLGWNWVPPWRQYRRASTCYAAGGTPLTATQEDFLVLFFFSARNVIVPSLSPDSCFARPSWAWLIDLVSLWSNFESPGPKDAWLNGTAITAQQIHFF